MSFLQVGTGGDLMIRERQRSAPDMPRMATLQAIAASMMFRIAAACSDPEGTNSRTTSTALQSARWTILALSACSTSQSEQNTGNGIGGAESCRLEEISTHPSTEPATTSRSRRPIPTKPGRHMMCRTSPVTITSLQEIRSISPLSNGGALGSSRSNPRTETFLSVALAFHTAPVRTIEAYAGISTMYRFSDRLCFRSGTHISFDRMLHGSGSIAVSRRLVRLDIATLDHALFLVARISWTRCGQDIE